VSINIAREKKKGQKKKKKKLFNDETAIFRNVCVRARARIFLLGFILRGFIGRSCDPPA
jgi:hypothetical protein